MIARLYGCSGVGHAPHAARHPPPPHPRPLCDSERSEESRASPPPTGKRGFQTRRPRWAHPSFPSPITPRPPLTGSTAEAPRVGERNVPDGIETIVSDRLDRDVDLDDDAKLYVMAPSTNTL